MNTDFIPHYSKQYVDDIFLTGSRAILPFVMPWKDYDYAVASEDIGELIESLQKYGYKLESDSEHYETTKFYSLRKEKVNIIAIPDVDFFKKWVLATEAAKSMRLWRRKDRVTLFSTVLYENIHGDHDTAIESLEMSNGHA